MTKFPAIGQLIGVGYTYKPSLAMRKHMTKNLAAHHSSQSKNFTYFYKGQSAVLQANGTLRLRTDPQTGAGADHWPEPELAMLLGEQHQILGYTLGIDFTAHSIELKGRTPELDGTYFGKVWDSCCVVGPKFILPSEIKNIDDLNISILICRQGKKIYDNSYSTKQRIHEFIDIPHMIVDYRKDFPTSAPKSKEIEITKNGYLPAGTLILLGAGLIMPHRCYSQAGDVFTIQAPEIGLELKAEVLAAESSAAA